MAEQPPPNLMQLLPEEILFHVLSRISDVPEVLSLRRTDTNLNALTTTRFFVEYFNNNRHHSPVWLFGHSHTDLHPSFGVFWGYRLEDNRMMIQPVHVLLGQQLGFNAARFLDVDGSHFLLILTPNPTMLVMNPFEGRQTRINLPSHMFPGNMLDVPHHLSIMSDHPDRFRIVYARLVNDAPVYHLFHSDAGVWVSRVPLLAGNNPLVLGFNTRYTVADVDNHLLYTIYHPSDNRDPVYTVAQIWDHHVADPEIFSSIGFIGAADFAVVRRYRVWIPHMLSLVEVLLYRRHMDAAPGFVLLGMIDLPQELLGFNAFHSMNGRLIGPILYIHVLTRGNLAMGGPPLLFVFRYHIQNAQWLQRIRIPFPAIAAFLHSTPAFTHSLTLVIPNDDN